jgi:hypothetical protein
MPDPDEAVGQSLLALYKTVFMSGFVFFCAFKLNYLRSSWIYSYMFLNILFQCTGMAVRKALRALRASTEGLFGLIGR